MATFHLPIVSDHPAISGGSLGLTSPEKVGQDLFGGSGKNIEVRSAYSG